MCRTLYLRIDRQDFPRVSSQFDVAPPDFSVARRSETIVPQQQLFLMNSEFVSTLAEQFAATQLNRDEDDVDYTIGRLFQCLFARDATADEQQLCREYIRIETRDHADVDEATAALWNAARRRLDAWAHLTHALLQANEMALIE